VSTQIEPEEVGAILELFGAEDARPPAEVVERDFTRPRRVSQQRHAEILRAARRSLRDIVAAIRDISGSAWKLDLTDAEEADADGFARGVTRPFVIGQFQAGGAPAWITWQNAPAVAMVEQILGSAGDGDDDGSRELSPLEARVLHRLLEAVAQDSSRSLGLDFANFASIEDPVEIASWTEAGEDADSHRLCLNYELHGPGGPSTLHVYLPGLASPGPARAAGAAAPALPAHLGPVEVEVAAVLGGAKVPLADLLALEPGDVIPLEDAQGEPLTLTADGVPCGHARLGTHRGRLAVQIEDAHLPPAGEPAPTPQKR
jgi:flagellar motor switch protein FliM